MLKWEMQSNRKPRFRNFIMYLGAPAKECPNMLCYDIERGSYVNCRTPLSNAQRLNIFKKIKIPSELGSQRTLGSVGCNYPN